MMKTILFIKSFLTSKEIIKTIKYVYNLLDKSMDIVKKKDKILSSNFSLTYHSRTKT